MKTALGILAAVLIFIAYRSLLRRTQRALGADPDTLVSIVQRHVWLQWYLVALMFVIAGVVYATTNGIVELSGVGKIGVLVGGGLLLVIPIFLARHR